MITKISDYVFSHKRLLVLLIIINIIGFFYGIYYYQEQLNSTSILLWIFTLDSPLAVLLFSFFLITLLIKKESVLLAVFSFIGLIKYGFWTALVLLLHFDFFFSANQIIYALNLPLHIGMILEGFIIFPLLKKKKLSLLSLIAVLFVFSFFIINDILDYTVGTVTYVPQNYLVYLFIESVAATIILLVILLKQFYKH